MSATAEQKESAIEAYVDGILQENLKEHHQKFGADAPVSQERIDQVKYSLRARAGELIEAIESKELLYRTWLHGRFHPSNKHSRKLFEALTGLKLPQRVGDTAIKRLTTIWYCLMVQGCRSCSRTILSRT